MTFGQLLVTHCHCEEDDHSADFLLMWDVPSPDSPEVETQKGIVKCKDPR